MLRGKHQEDCFQASGTKGPPNNAHDSAESGLQNGPLQSSKLGAPVTAGSKGGAGWTTAEKSSVPDPLSIRQPAPKE